MLTTNRLKELAGYLNEAAMVPSFGLKNEDHVKKACLAIAKAGITVDMEYFGDVFYFNFKTKKAHDTAKAVVKKQIDIKDEEEFQ